MSNRNNKNHPDPKKRNWIGLRARRIFRLARLMAKIRRMEYEAHFPAPKCQRAGCANYCFNYVDKFQGQIVKYCSKVCRRKRHNANA